MPAGIEIFALRHMITAQSTTMSKLSEEFFVFAWPQTQTIEAFWFIETKHPNELYYPSLFF